MKHKGIGWRIQIARKEAGLNQGELAEAAGVHRVTIARIESGETAITSDLLSKISLFLKKPINYFYEEAVPQQVSEPGRAYGAGQNTVRLPILAHFPAGLPGYEDEDVIGIVELPRFLYPGAKFIVRWEGGPAQGEIISGDYCIIRPTAEPARGKIMILKEGEKYVLRKITVKAGRAGFAPPGPKNIEPGKIKIIGEVTGILRKI